MAVVSLPVLIPDADGAAPVAYTDATSPALADGTLSTGDQFTIANDQRTGLRVTNGATDAVIRFERPTTDAEGEARPARDVTVSANTTRYFSRFIESVYGSTLKFAIDDVSNVSVEVIRT